MWLAGRFVAWERVSGSRDVSDMARVSIWGGDECEKFLEKGKRGCTSYLSAMLWDEGLRYVEFVLIFGEGVIFVFCKDSVIAMFECDVLQGLRNKSRQGCVLPSHVYGCKYLPACSATCRMLVAAWPVPPPRVRARRIKWVRGRTWARGHVDVTRRGTLGATWAHMEVAWPCEQARAEWRGRRSAAAMADDDGRSVTLAAMCVCSEDERFLVFLPFETRRRGESIYLIPVGLKVSVPRSPAFVLWEFAIESAV